MTKSASWKMSVSEYLATQDGPCFQCGNSERCRRDGLSCPDFADFVATGKTVSRDREPSRQRFQRLFSDG